MRASPLAVRDAFSPNCAAVAVDPARLTFAAAVGKIIPVEVPISPELEKRIREKVEAGAADSVQAFVENVVRRALGLNSGLSAETAERPVWDVILSNMEDVPPEQFAALPTDGASQVDHYLYGHPKR
jgi:hypothetical protein